MGVLRDMEISQGLPRGRKVVAVATLYGQGEAEAASLNDGCPLRALLAPVEPRRPPFSVRDSGAFT
jgi:hypothetical protein